MVCGYEPSTNRSPPSHLRCCSLCVANTCDAGVSAIVVVSWKPANHAGSSSPSSRRSSAAASASRGLSTQSFILQVYPKSPPLSHPPAADQLPPSPYLPHAIPTRSATTALIVWRHGRSDTDVKNLCPRDFGLVVPGKPSLSLTLSPIYITRPEICNKVSYYLFLPFSLLVVKPM